jgi:type II secretory pathway component HofQ
VANEITYVTSSTTTSAANVGTSVTQNTGTVVVGFTANFLPLILGDHRILLSYQMQISALASPLTPYAQGIQTPNIASQSLQQQAFLNDGQAIVLFGFDEQSSGSSKAVEWAGASSASTQARQMVVIVVQVNAGFKHA